MHVVLVAFLDPVLDRAPLPVQFRSALQAVDPRHDPVLQHDVARLVDAVHVAEGQRGQVATGLSRPQGGDRLARVVDGAVQLVVDLVLDAVLADEEI